jgi:hypothetical protein
MQINDILPKNLTLFFANEGISTTDANHTANLIKEYAGNFESQLLTTGSVVEKVTLDGKEVVLLNSQKVDIINNLKTQGGLYGLSAWLREAIKAKEELAEFVEDTSLINFLVDEDGAYPTMPASVKQPSMKMVNSSKNFTEADVIATFTVAERADYFANEAMASHLGKKIHNDGLVNVLRKQIKKFVPIRLQQFQIGTGPKDFVVDRTLVYTVDEIDSIFFTLQDMHREAEKQVNWYKARIKNDMTRLTAEDKKRYADEIAAAREQFRVENEMYLNIVATYNSACNVLNEKLQARKLEAKNMISKLKVIIPNCFNDIYEFIKAYKG